MSKVTVNEIRKNFLDYFVKNGHAQVAASSLIPHNDPTLMFVNSGMVQFKNVFTGVEKRDYVRATSSQKSVRAGGKHNDLDNVGYTARHHTFFEMLGNFSFGDYFKEQAIAYAWELLTKDFALDKSKLYATIYHTDDEAYNFWKKISGFSDDRIIRIKTNDNFWSMGDTGPCGPCSEIFYDHGEHIPGGLPGTPDEDGDRFIEIWNMVFMQYEQVNKDTRIELPNQSIDTGMGLERIAAVMQGVHDNYDIDLFVELIKASEDLTSTKAEGEAKFSHRVIADHLRSTAFLMADGVMPSNEGRGYVLRRIMRRAMRHAHQLGAKEPLMYRLYPKLIELMGGAYPELKRAEGLVTATFKAEEERFKATVDRGLKLLDSETETLTTGGKLSGDVAFKLYDTYGFPLDLTEDILKNRDISVDHDGFNRNMQEQKERARQAWAGSGEAATNEIWFNINERCGATEFLGYSHEAAQGQIVALVAEGNEVKSFTHTGKEFILIANQTPFYGESGGQMGDIGHIILNNGARVKVKDTKKYLGAIHAHFCELETGEVVVGQTADFAIDVKYRNNLRKHHSATHILHAVLRKQLGEHITQKGSLVAFDRLRFDISHGKSLTKDEITAIEHEVNEIIMQNSEVKTVLMDTEAAIEAGAMALFGEKYDAEVRVVSMGVEDKGANYSIELCGGTHVSRTGDIGAFKITSEAAIAAGVRRIEAVCGTFALDEAKKNEETLASIAEILKTGRNDLEDKLNALVLERKELERELFENRKAQLALSKEQIAAQAKEISGKKFICKTFKSVDPKVLRSAVEENITRSDELVLIYISEAADGKLSIVVGVSKPISNVAHAGQIAKAVSLLLGGQGGGGKETIAQAGGVSLENLGKIEEVVISEFA